MGWPENFTQKEVEELSKAIDVLVNSEQFGNWCENANYHSLTRTLEEFKDDLCVHDWKQTGEKTYAGDGWEETWVEFECAKCGEEREEELD